MVSDIHYAIAVNITCDASVSLNLYRCIVRVDIALFGGIDRH
jgi:hypothetical protein